MSSANWRNSGGPSRQFGASNSPNSGPRRPRRENVRFGVNGRGKAQRNNLCIDEHIQEATPEHLRIEIDKIFADFLADPEKTEHIFPPDYNNLQRKYIHYQAQKMNLVSKSQGKEPNRQLHLKKKPKQLASQSFQVPLCDEIYNELQDFDTKYDTLESEPEQYRPIKRYEKIYGRLQDNEPNIPDLGKFDKHIQQIRQNLPIFERQESVLDAIAQHQVTIISSETGSGKTTQVPQYILEEAAYNRKPCKIICTQPRRISTIAAAERVAYERGENVGGSVGYQIRLESKCGYSTNLLFCTVGVFLRNLMCGNRCLENITHVIVDEIHERDKLSDFLLICLKQNLSHFPHLRVVLMSATVDTLKFQQYFNSSSVLTIPGRLFSIQTYFVEDVLSMTQFFTPQMRMAMNKLQQKQATLKSPELVAKVELSEQDQANFNDTLEAYMNFSEDYDYTINYEEATIDLLQLFISEDVSVDQQHSERGWTALMIACHVGDVEFVSKLCTLGASLDIYDHLGKTAFDYANVSNKNNIWGLLNHWKEQNSSVQAMPNTNDSQYLRQLYDMTTPDDFIDYDLIVALIKYIHANSDSGSILIFLPGYDEIMQCNDHIVDSDLDTSSYRVFFLHSSMNMKDQCDIFKSLPNQRKLILSTNIAETSITVEDVVFVIDVGKAKEKVYDAYNKLSALQTQWISRACAKQRQGRAGRVRPGFCFRLFSNQRYSHMAEERVPEILRVSLEELCLHAKIIAPRSMNIYNFLCLAPDPPTSNSVGVAIENLQSLGALDKEEDLTRLGEYLAQLTLEPRLGKMLVYACIFKCLEPMLTLCAAMAHKDPFQLPPQANLKTVAAAKRRELIDGVPSDHSIYLVVFQKWQEESMRGRSKQFCHEYFISETTMYSVLETRRQLLGQLRAVGFVNNTHSIDDFNNHCDSWGLVKAIMSAAFFPNVAYPVQRGLALATRNEKKVVIHNTSVCSSKRFENWCFYDEMVKNRINFMVRGVTACTPLMIAIMCGVDTVYPSSHSVNIDEWLEFYFGDTLAIKFRKAVHTLIDKSMSNPWNSYDRKNLIVSETLRKVMDMCEENAEFAQPNHVGIRPKFLFKIIHEGNVGSKKSKIMSRDNMGQQPGFNNYHNTSHSNAESIERHKKGRTPKRYIPPNRRSEEQNSDISKNLAFDNLAPSTSVTNHLTNNFQDLNLASAPSPNPAEALLNGLVASNESNINHSSVQQNNRPRRNYNNSYNRNGYSNNYNGYNSRDTGNNFNQYSHTFYNTNQAYYGNSDGNFYLPQSSNYGRQDQNNGTFDGLYDEACAVIYPARKISKNQDLPDFQYQDAYSVPAFNNDQYNCFNNVPLRAVGETSAASLPALDFLTQSTTTEQPQQYTTNPAPLQTTGPTANALPYLPQQYTTNPAPPQTTGPPANALPYLPQQYTTNPAPPQTTGPPANALPYLLIEKTPNYPDNPIFVIIKANEKRNIDIAQSCSKWVFSPQTEKKVLHLVGQEKTVYMIFFVKDLQMFMGIAEYRTMHVGKHYSKPTASILWRYVSPLHKNKTKHLINPYNFNKPIYDSQDGVVVRQDVGEELLRIYAECEVRI